MKHGAGRFKFWGVFRLLYRADPTLTEEKHLSVLQRHAPPSGWFFVKKDSSSSGIMSPNKPQSFDTTTFTFITFLGPERVRHEFSAWLAKPALLS